MISMHKSGTIFLISVFFFTMFCLPAFSQDGFISARNFAETQGISYQWFPIQKMLVMRKGLKSLKLTVNETRAIVDDKEIILPAAPMIKDGQIMVPATAIIRAFQGNLQENVPEVIPPVAPAQVNPPPISPPAIQVSEPVTNDLNTAPPPIKPPTAAVTNETDSSESVLVALRHSSREDHTRVVLEFSSNITYTTDLKDDIFRLVIQGCRNLVPTKRTNPVGKAITKFDINSGPNRTGLILSFKVSQTKRLPEIETIGGPFRMIISFFPSADEIPTATATAQVATVTSPIVDNRETDEKPVEKVVQKEKVPEINIEVPLEKLSNESFQGRTVVIDPGHGGDDPGFEFPGRTPEKTINLSVAGFLKKSLEKAGLKAVLLRSTDEEIPQSKRISIANRNGADLLISLHVGGSVDENKSGIACMVFGKAGTEIPEGDAGLTEGAVYKEWLGNTRFDLASFLAKRINERLKTQLKVESRGIKQLPLLQLKYVLNPAVVVEMGMLSEKTEGKNLLSPKYHEAIAACITNGVIDFFNGIVIKP